MVFLALSAAAQPAGSPVRNHVLELDGTGSHVELPPDIFNGLTAATVEGWVKWHRIGRWTRFFGYGDANHAVSIVNV